MNIAGGSKTSLLVGLIFLILIKEKNRRVHIKKNFIKMLGVITLISIATLTSFYIMQKTDSPRISTIPALISMIIEYAQEAFFSANVLQDFDWTPAYIYSKVRSFIFTPLPRAFFPGKGYYGFYQEFWRPLYQPNTVTLSH